MIYKTANPWTLGVRTLNVAIDQKAENAKCQITDDSRMMR